MKLQQLRYIWEIAQHELNVSATADSLYTSQPGISKQVNMLESELGVPIFARKGKQYSDITEPGKQIISLAAEILGKVEDIRKIAQDYKTKKVGTLSIATTHTQARYALPPIVREFMALYPGVKFQINQGTPRQISELASHGLVDMAIATETIEHFENLVLLPCYEWNRCIVLPKSHPLIDMPAITLQDIAHYPIVTYVFGFTGRSQLDKAFENLGIHPEVVLTAVDADVIKTYVRLGLGVGIMARMAYDPVLDSDLTTIDAEHLFGRSVTKICLRRDMYIRSFIYDFIRLFAPHLTKKIIHEALELNDRQAVKELFKHIPLPVR